MSKIKDFGDDYHVVHQITKARARQQTRLMERFEDELGRPIETGTANDLRDFIRREVEAGFKPTTIAVHLSMLRPFYRWAFQRGLITAEAWLQIAQVQPPRGANGDGLPRPYKRTELAEFRASLEKAWPHKSAVSLRRWENGTSSYHRVWRHGMRLQVEAMIVLALELGLRRSEIYHLSLDDMHPDNAAVVVHGKRDSPYPKVREIPHTARSREAITAWFRFRRMMAPNHDRPWLAMIRPVELKPMRWDRFKTLLHTVPGAGKGDQHWEWHRFRHTCATLRYQAGMPIERLQVFLGHKDIKMTLRYTRISRDEVAESMTASEEKFQAALNAA